MSAALLLAVLQPAVKASRAAVHAEDTELCTVLAVLETCRASQVHGLQAAEVATVQAAHALPEPYRGAGLGHSRGHSRGQRGQLLAVQVPMHATDQDWLSHAGRAGGADTCVP